MEAITLTNDFSKLFFLGRYCYNRPNNLGKLLRVFGLRELYFTFIFKIKFLPNIIRLFGKVTKEIILF